LRSIGQDEENAIGRVDVLTFRYDPLDNSRIIFDYYAEGYAITDNSFSVRVLIKNYEQLFVVIANAEPELIKEQFDSSWSGREKDELLGYLKYSFPADNQWTTAAYSKIPMSGESQWMTIGPGDRQITGAISLMRMVAKITVQIDEQRLIDLGKKFKLDCVYLYRGNSSGYIVPDATNISGTKAVLPTVPSDTEQIYSAPFYNDGQYPSVKDVAIRGALYTFEAENSIHFDDPQQAVALVVGGRYGEGNVTDTTYYRVDFMTADRSGFLDILRNYQYDFHITDVTNTGHQTPDDAYKSRIANMTVNVVPWYDQPSMDIVFIGQAFLNVSKNSFSFSRMSYTGNTGNNVVQVKSNYPYGWNINPDWIVDAITGEKISWLRLTNMGQPYPDCEDTHEIVILLDSNDTGKERVAQFIIAAGHLHYPITVRQTLTEGITVDLFRGDFNISINDTIHSYDDIIFPSDNDNSASAFTRSFHVRWRPKNQILVRYMMPIEGVPILRLTDDVPWTQLFQNDTGTRNFAYVNFHKTTSESLAKLVTEENPFPEKQSYGTYIGTNGIETLEKRYIYRMIYFNCKVAGERNSYLLNGSPNTFFVRSNNAWRVLNITDPDNILQNKSTLLTRTGGERAKLNSDVFTFSLVNDPSKNNREAKIVFGVDDGLYRDEYRTDTVTIRGIYQ
jgi:hypothetical protein